VTPKAPRRDFRRPDSTFARATDELTTARARNVQRSGRQTVCDAASDRWRRSPSSASILRFAPATPSSWRC
jgi:hypothetical protein